MQFKVETVLPGPENTQSILLKWANSKPSCLPLPFFCVLLRKHRSYIVEGNRVPNSIYQRLNFEPSCSSGENLDSCIFAECFQECLSSTSFRPLSFLINPYISQSVQFSAYHLLVVKLICVVDPVEIHVPSSIHPSIHPSNQTRQPSPNTPSCSLPSYR